MKDLNKLREQLHTLKIRGMSELREDISNLDDILKEYKQIHKVGKDLVKLPGKSLGESLTTQASEYYFFRMCVGNLRAMVEFFEHFVKHERGNLAEKIRASSSRELNDRAISQLVDANDTIFALTSQLLQTKEVYDQFMGVLESYNQRGYAMNNITKALEIEVLATIL